MSHLQIAVLRGGPGEEHLISMKTGAAVLDSLNSATTHKIKDVVITKQGEWLDGGVVKGPEILLRDIDLVFVALHGTYGEDGQVQKILQRHNLPFTGSNSFSSAIAFNKALTKQTLSPYNILVPQSKLVTKDDDAELDSIVKEINETFGPEYVIKPAQSGSSFGVKLIRAGEDLKLAIESATASYSQILVEEFVRGREASCATLANYRNDAVYVFPTIEIILNREHQFYNTEAKYDNSILTACPANFSYGERAKIAEVAALAHEALQLSQYSRSDFIVNKHGVYFLEVNTLPGLATESLYPRAAASVGLNFDELIVHLIETASR